jgi:Ca2+/Na+ antiporter
MKMASPQMPELEKMAVPSTHYPTSKPAVGAILTGVLIAILGYVAAIAQGMVTAPSHAAANVAVLVMILGFALALCGLASVWLPRFRRPARITNYVALVLLTLAFFADKAMIALE